MKSAYKWRITNTKYAYLSDEENYGPFIYSKSDYNRKYLNKTTFELADDAMIADVVSELDLDDYTSNFNDLITLLSTDPEGSKLKLLPVEYYYNMEVDECTVKATTVECEGYDPIINIEAITLPSESAATADLKVTRSDVDMTIHYDVTIGIPKGEQGEQGTTATLQIPIDNDHVAAYPKPVHTEYTEIGTNGLYNTLHLAPIPDGDALTENSTVKEGETIIPIGNSTLVIDYDTTELKNIKANGNTILNSGLTVNGETIVNKLTANGNVFLNSSTTVNNITVNGNSVMNSGLTVNGETTIENLNVTSSLTLNEETKQELTREVTQNIYQDLVPTGSILMWPTATPPSGWTLCDGREIEIELIEYGEGDFSIDTYKLEDYNREFENTNGTKIWIKDIFLVKQIKKDDIPSYKSLTIYDSLINYVMGEQSSSYIFKSTKNKITFRRVDAALGKIDIYINNDKYEQLSNNYNFYSTLVPGNFKIHKEEEKKFTKLFSLLPQIVRTNEINGYNYLSLPNFNEKFPYGTTNDDELLTSGGTENVTLELKHLPSHKHSVGDLKITEGGTHSHSINVCKSSTAVSGLVRYGENTIPIGIRGENSTRTTYEDGKHTHTITGITGSISNGTNRQESFSILPPYFGINFIIKYI